MIIKWTVSGGAAHASFGEFSMYATCAGTWEVGYLGKVLSEGRCNAKGGLTASRKEAYSQLGRLMKKMQEDISDTWEQLAFADTPVEEVEEVG